MVHSSLECPTFSRQPKCGQKKDLNAGYVRKYDAAHQRSRVAPAYKDAICFKETLLNAAASSPYSQHDPTRPLDSIMAAVGGGLVSLAPKREDAPEMGLLAIQNKAVEDPDVYRCAECGLPVGNICVTSDEGYVLHGECAAQLLLLSEKEKERKEQAKEAALKKTKRAQYDIGWKVESIPRNCGRAAKLDVESNPHGMYCLKLADRDEPTVVLAFTQNPAAAVNLEYLAIALKVRIQSGRECFFSLDPKRDLENPGQELKHQFQVKRFEPAWLAGTSVGEVLCQADIYLKELSMGEHQQPVAGMKSAFDLIQEMGDEDWSAREWFMVKKASVQTQDAELIPRVEIGVEAREQIDSETGFVDAPVTRAEHPLVKYAEAFTYYFDLIAERKSVIHHLREVAKASVLAKFLVENEIAIEKDSWLGLADESMEAYCLEVPQLWNERRYAHWGVKYGQVDLGRSQLRGVYGGVNFGLDAAGSLLATQPLRRPAAAVAVAPPRLEAEKIKPVKPELTTFYPGSEAVAMAKIIETGLAAMSGGFVPAGGAARGTPEEIIKSMEPTAIRGMGGSVMSAAMSAEGSQVVPFSALAKVPPRFLKSRVGLLSVATAMERASPVLSLAAGVPPVLSLAAGIVSSSQTRIPRGVDLNLNMFDLSDLELDTPMATQDGSWAACFKSSRQPVGDTFWSDIEPASCSAIMELDRQLLRQVFHPKFSDRRDEGRLFKPPETSSSYVSKLQELVREEQDMQKIRKIAFLSKEFNMESPGPLFPSCWTSFITGGNKSSQFCASTLHERPDYQGEKDRFERVLKSSAPVFDKSTEDGVRFRIYQVGTLQVRTLMEQDCKEMIHVFFSTLPPSTQSRQPSGGSVDGQEEIAQVIQYVDGDGVDPHFFVVIGTDGGNQIVTERRVHGTAVHWSVNPLDLEGRIALAKVTRSAINQSAGITIGGVQQFYDDEKNRIQHLSRHVSRTEVRCYAQDVFDKAVPIRERRWASLTVAQRLAAGHLGVASDQWDKQGVKGLRAAWEDLDDTERHHASVLGFDESSWTSSEEKPKP